jgi:hypothetical protein
LGTFQDSGGTRTVGDATNDAALFFQMFRIGGAPTPGVGQTDGWTLDDAATWTYVSSTTFTVSGDQTAKFSKGTRIKLTQTTVKYFVVTASSFGAGVTTVTITGGTSYTFANAAVSANYYSYAVNPQGYPTIFAFTPTYTGFSADPTGAGYFRVVGTVCTFFLSPTAGTSNAVGFTLSLPITVLGSVAQSAKVRNNSVDSTTPGAVIAGGGGTTLDVYRDWANMAWTASGSKNATFIFEYLI